MTRDQAIAVLELAGCEPVKKDFPENACRVGCGKAYWNFTSRVFEYWINPPFYIVAWEDLTTEHLIDVASCVLHDGGVIIGNQQMEAP